MDISDQLLSDNSSHQLPSSPFSFGQEGTESYPVIENRLPSSSASLSASSSFPHSSTENNNENSNRSMLPSEISPIDLDILQLSLLRDSAAQMFDTGSALGTLQYLRATHKKLTRFSDKLNLSNVPSLPYNEPQIKCTCGHINPLRLCEATLKQQIASSPDSLPQNLRLTSTSNSRIPLRCLECDSLLYYPKPKSSSKISKTKKVTGKKKSKAQVYNITAKCYFCFHENPLSTLEPQVFKCQECSRLVEVSHSASMSFKSTIKNVKKARRAQNGADPFAFADLVNIAEQDPVDIFSAENSSAVTTTGQSADKKSACDHDDDDSDLVPMLQ